MLFKHFINELFGGPNEPNEVAYVIRFKLREGQ